MDTQEAERLYSAGKEAVIAKLLGMATRIQELEKRNSTLERTIFLLLLNSNNSSRPPSTDRPNVKRENKKRPSRKKQGAQPGHKGVKRELLPAEAMDKIHDIYPDTCEQCQRPFTPEEKVPLPSFLRHQVFDLPVIEPTKEEFRCYSINCTCGHRTAAPLPEAVAQSNFGPRTHAAIGYLAANHHLSRRGIAETMKTLFGLDISTGAVCDAAARVSEACVPVVDVIKRYTAAALHLNIDETGWKCKGKPRYLWVFVSVFAVYFIVSESRGAKVLIEVLGKFFAGTITSDDHSAYRAYHKGLRQLCWAHIIRKLKALKESRGSPDDRDAYLFAKNMLREIGTIFTYWHAFLESGCTRQQLWLATALIRGRMKNLCLRYRNSSNAAVCTRAKRLLDNWEHLFTFLRVEGVEPTNNAAERALRPGVQWRKNCFGSQSEWGEQFTARLLTVTRTCQLQGVNAFNFLADLMTATFNRQPLPKLPHFPN